MISFPFQVDGERAQLVRSNFDRLLDSGTNLSTVDMVARELLAETPGFHPASVLLGQVHLLRGADRSVLEILDPVAAELPTYLACQLVRGRAAERLGDVVTAFRAFRAIADRQPTAAERQRELLFAAVDQGEAEVEAALGRGQLEDAELWLGELVSWIGPDDPRLLALDQRVAAALDDPEREIEAIRRQLSIEPRRELRVRQGELEVELGDVRQGLRIFEDLVAEDPEDQGIVDRLERAKFLWRLQVLPVAVQQLGQQPSLDRADLATLLYWLVPSVRYARINNPPIAADILDHARRDEIVRVTNLGLMRVDQTLHRFDPGQPVSRATVLYALLMLMQQSEQSFACLLPDEVETLAGKKGLICGKAAECGLLPEVADCLPAAEISGSEAMELFRQGLRLLGPG